MCLSGDSHTFWLTHLIVIICIRQLIAAYYYYYYHCLSENQRWPCTKEEATGGLPLGQSTGKDRQQFQTYISCIKGVRVVYLPFCARVYPSLHLYFYCWQMVKWFKETAHWYQSHSSASEHYIIIVTFLSVIQHVLSASQRWIQHGQHERPRKLFLAK